MGSAKKTISYRYDANRNRTLMIDPDGGRTTYTYDALNRITSLINPQGERTTYAYDPKGRRTVKKLANGTRASFTYDAANRITTLANLKSDNTVISKFDYKYDNVGNRTEVAEADGSRVTWSYDDTYQLTAEHRTGTIPYRNTFTYDSVGNRLLKNETGARTTYSYDAANQLEASIDASGTTTYTFDADGNQELVQAPNNDRTTTVWDYENKTTLVELPTGIRNTMAYEPDGLRVKLEDSTGTKKFIWDNQKYLAESDENDDINVVYTNKPNYYGNLVSQYRKSGAVWTPSYYHYEALGSTRQLIDDTEAITDTYLYDAWGNIINSSGSTENSFQFTGNVGYYFDVDTENQYIRARIYSPTNGRWMSIDPVFSTDGQNVYYADFIPNDIDPSGLIAIELIDYLSQEPNCNNLRAARRVWEFSIPNRAKCNGFFVQKVTVRSLCKPCLDNCNKDYEIQQTRIQYFEAWPVQKRKKKSWYRTQLDTFLYRPEFCGVGYRKQHGEVRFYCNSDVGLDDNLAREASIPNWEPQGGARVSYPIGEDNFCGRTTPGSLTSTGSEPSFWKEGKGVEPVAFRNAELNYHCCSKSKKCCGDGKIKATVTNVTPS